MCGLELRLGLGAVTTARASDTGFPWKYPDHAQVTQPRRCDYRNLVTIALVDTSEGEISPTPLPRADFKRYVARDAHRPAEPADAIADRRNPAAGGAGRPAHAACRPGCLRAVQHRGDHRLLRRPPRAHAPPAIRPRPYAGPDRRQTPGRRRADDAGGAGAGVQLGTVPRHRHHAAGDPGERTARISRRDPYRPAGDAAGEMEDRFPDGRARHASGRRFVSAVAAPVVHSGRRHRRGHAVGRRRADTLDRLGLPDRRPPPCLRRARPVAVCPAMPRTR